MKVLRVMFALLAMWGCTACSDDNGDGPKPDTVAPEFSATIVDDVVTLEWAESGRFEIWRSDDGGQFEEIATIGESPYTDDVSMLSDNVELAYRMVSENGDIYSSDALAHEQKVRISRIADEDLLDLIQSRTLRYFSDYAHPQSGMARERNDGSNTVTTGGTGFGVMALIVGTDRGFISRADAFGQIRRIVDFLMRADRFHGAYAHWYDGSTGRVLPFSEQDDGGDLVETGFLFQGLLTAREYFSAAGATDEELRLVDDIDRLWQEVEWNWYERDGALKWHWSPNYDFAINLSITGWNEALIVYVLAAASPTYPIQRETYTQGFARGGGIRNGRTYYNIVLPLGDLSNPLFFAHYSFLGLDPRGLGDEICADYFEQNKAQTLINRAYCIENPKHHAGYSDRFWGLTASDCPVAGYLAHAPGDNDNGTVSPTAALSSMPYAPDECLAVARGLYSEFGSDLFGDYGFYDAVNLDVPADRQVVRSYLAIDQGPIVVMIENYRSQLLWNTFMKNADVQNGLRLLGFTSPALQ